MRVDGTAVHAWLVPACKRQPLARKHAELHQGLLREQRQACESVAIVIGLSPLYGGLLDDLKFEQRCPFDVILFDVPEMESVEQPWACLQLIQQQLQLLSCLGFAVIKRPVNDGPGLRSLEPP